MRAASCDSASSLGRVAALMRVGKPNSIDASSSRIDPGKLRNTGPIGGVIAILAARRTMRGKSSIRVTSNDHFTSGLASSTSGSYSSGSCSPYPISYCPAVMISGDPENFAL